MLWRGSSSFLKGSGSRVSAMPPLPIAGSSLNATVAWQIGFFTQGKRVQRMGHRSP